jgi:hypothetical protein
VLALGVVIAVAMGLIAWHEPARSVAAVHVAAALGVTARPQLANAERIGPARAPRSLVDATF